MEPRKSTTTPPEATPRSRQSQPPTSRSRLDDMLEEMLHENQDQNVEQAIQQIKSQRPLRNHPSSPTVSQQSSTSYSIGGTEQLLAYTDANYLSNPPQGPPSILPYTTDTPTKNSESLPNQQDQTSPEKSEFSVQSIKFDNPEVDCKIFWEE